MSNRLATRIGLLAGEDRASDALDLVRFREPTTGSEVRTKGSLFLLAQVTGVDPALGRAAAEALETIERDYYYDLSAGATGAISKALSAANRLLYHQRSRLGLTRRGDLPTKLKAFDLGVDDILTVPFSPEELLARSIVITRRAP